MADAHNHIEFAVLLDDLTDLEKLTAAKKVAETIATPGWALVVQLLEDRKSQRLDRLMRHVPVESEAWYARDLAEARGYEKALNAAQTVLHAAEQAAQRLSEAEGGR